MDISFKDDGNSLKSYWIFIVKCLCDNDNNLEQQIYSDILQSKLHHKYQLKLETLYLLLVIFAKVSFAFMWTNYFQLCCLLFYHLIKKQTKQCYLEFELPLKQQIDNLIHLEFN